MLDLPDLPLGLTKKSDSNLRWWVPVDGKAEDSWSQIGDSYEKCESTGDHEIKLVDNRQGCELRAERLGAKWYSFLDVERWCAVSFTCDSPEVGTSSK
jgi:hypothetical protein